MPVTVAKTNGKYRVSTPNQTHAFGTTKKKAERQARLLRAVDHGWHPTGKAARESEATAIANRLLEFDFEPGTRPGSKEDPWRQTKGPLPKMKFLRKEPKRFDPGKSPLEQKKKELPKPNRFQWKPGETTSEAQSLADALLEVDDVGSLPIPASGKQYARLRGMGGLRRKQQLFINMNRDLGNRGKSTMGFPNREGSAYTAREGLERHHTEQTKFYGGKYGKGVPSEGKTGGKFKMPGNWRVGHAIKS